MKKYIEDEEKKQPMTVNEPIATYGKITTEQGAGVIKSPCEYTEEEVLQACEIAIQEYETDTLVTSDQIKRKVV